MMTEQFPILYILMRNDMDSMNPGKAMAQASHAANAFVANDIWEMEQMPDGIVDLKNQWQNETTQGFGTVIVLAVNEEQMRMAVGIARSFNVVSDIIHDPTYPLLDGDTCHFLPIDTCAYIFSLKGDHSMVDSMLGDFPLHP